MDVGKLIQSMNDYAPGAHQVMDTMAAALRPVALVLIGIFFLLEVIERAAELKLEGGSMTPRVLGEIVFYYFVAFLLVWQSQLILDGILSLSNGFVKIADKVVPAKEISHAVDIGKIKGTVLKGAISFIGGSAHWISGHITTLLVMIRYYQMYIAGTIAPIMVAFFVNRNLRNIAINFLKLFGAYALQGLVLLIIIRLYPYIVTNDLLKFNATDSQWSSWQIAFGSIAQAIIYIMMLAGSSRYIKQLMGVS